LTLTFFLSAPEKIRVGGTLSSEIKNPWESPDVIGLPGAAATGAALAGTLLHGLAAASGLDT